MLSQSFIFTMQRYEKYQNRQKHIINVHFQSVSVATTIRLQIAVFDVLVQITLDCSGC